MIYRFKSKASADLIMMESAADRILCALGKTPARQGLIQRSELSSAILSLEQAIEADDAARTSAAEVEPLPSAADEDVSLRRHAWPFLEMMRRSRQEGFDIIWES